jgi:hypothetical protein
MTKDETLKLALEALERTGNIAGFAHEREQAAITAIRETLAQPEQEPVACVQDLDEVKRKHLVYEKGMDWKDPLYTTPPQRKPLTDEQIVEIYTNWESKKGTSWADLMRAVEAAHDIKETKI